MKELMTEKGNAMGFIPKGKMQLAPILNVQKIILDKISFRVPLVRYGTKALTFAAQLFRS